MEDTKVFFSTLYAFSEAAKQQLAKDFARSGTGRAVLLGNAATTQFVLQFPNNDTDALSTFESLLKRCVEEDATLPSHGEAHLLRLTGTLPTVDETESDTERYRMTVSESITASTQDTQLTKHWNGTLGAHLTSEIGYLTGCSISLKLDGSGILVKGATIDDVERAMSKLDTVSTMMDQRSSFPTIFNFQISEGELNTVLQLMPLKDLNDRRLATTIVPTDLAKKLGNQLTVVMFKSGQVYPDFTGSKHKRSFQIESILWKDVLYECIGRSDISSPVIGARPLDNEGPADAVVQRRYRTLTDWVDESAAAKSATIDPFVPIPHEHFGQEGLQTKGLVNEALESNPNVKLSPHKRPVKARKAKGAIAEEVAVAKPVDSDLIPDMSSLHSVGETSRSLHPSKAPKELLTMFETSVNSAGNEELAQASSLAITNLFSTRGTYAAELAQLQPSGAPEIKPPYMPARSTTSSFTNGFLSSPPVWAHARVSADKEGSLIDLLAPESTEEQKQRKNGHRVKHTMRQRKAPSQTGSSQSEANTLKQYDDAIIRVLAMTRSTQGCVKLEIKIGRLMIDYQSGSAEFKKRSFAVGQWPFVFSNANTPIKLQSFITDRLTSLGSDADFIFQLKLSAGRNMFTPEPCERTTFYRFSCISTLRVQDNVIIDIYEDKNIQVRGTDMLVGALDLHFVKRYWDARIAITANDIVSENHKKAAQCIGDNLCVVPAPNQTHIDIFTKTKSKTFILQSIEVHRETRHRSTQYPDLLLKLSEVQELSFELSPTGTKQGQDYHAWTKPKEEMVNDGKLWWEVSLASVAAENMFKENEALELGETSTWRPNDIVDASIVRNMFHLGYAIVTHIDSVGYHNKGPKTGSSKEASEKAIANLGFW